MLRFIQLSKVEKLRAVQESQSTDCLRIPSTNSEKNHIFLNILNPQYLSAVFLKRWWATTRGYSRNTQALYITITQRDWRQVEVPLSEMLQTSKYLRFWRILDVGCLQTSSAQHPKFKITQNPTFLISKNFRSQSILDFWSKQWYSSCMSGILTLLKSGSL